MPGRVRDTGGGGGHGGGHWGRRGTRRGSPRPRGGLFVRACAEARGAGRNMRHVPYVQYVRYACGTCNTRAIREIVYSTDGIHYAWRRGVRVKRRQRPLATEWRHAAARERERERERERQRERERESRCGRLSGAVNSSPWAPRESCFGLALTHSLSLSPCSHRESCFALAVPPTPRAPFRGHALS